MGGRLLQGCSIYVGVAGAGTGHVGAWLTADQRAAASRRTWCPDRCR